MSHLVKLLTIIYIGVPFPEEAPGTDSQNSKYYNGHYTRPTICRSMDNCTICYMLYTGSYRRKS